MGQIEIEMRKEESIRRQYPSFCFFLPFPLHIRSLRFIVNKIEIFMNRNMPIDILI